MYSSVAKDIDKDEFKTRDQRSLEWGCRRVEKKDGMKKTKKPRLKCTACLLHYDVMVAVIGRHMLSHRPRAGKEISSIIGQLLLAECDALASKCTSRPCISIFIEYSYMSRLFLHHRPACVVFSHELEKGCNCPSVHPSVRPSHLALASSHLPYFLPAITGLEIIRRHALLPTGLHSHFNPKLIHFHVNRSPIFISEFFSHLIPFFRCLFFGVLSLLQSTSVSP